MIKNILDKLFGNTVYKYEDINNIHYIDKDIEYSDKNKSLLEVGEELLIQKEKKEALEKKEREKRQNEIDSTLYLTECQFLSYLITYFLNKEAGFLYKANPSFEPSSYFENKFNDYYPRIYLDNYDYFFSKCGDKVFYLNSSEDIFSKEKINYNLIKVGYDNNFYMDINFNFEKQKFYENIELDNDLCFSIYNELNKFKCYDFFEYRNTNHYESILSSGNLFYLKRILGMNDKTDKNYLFLKKLERIAKCIKEVVALEFKLEMGKDF